MSLSPRTDRPPPPAARERAAAARAVVAAVAAVLVAGPAAAQDAARDGPPAPTGADARGPFAEFLDATRGAEVWLELRARHESLRDDAFPERARASTLRTAFGLRTASFRGLRLGAELENVTVLGPRRYFDGLDGPSDRPTVLDPEGTTLNRVFAEFSDAGGLELRGGRVRYALHEGRLVGADPWRQNDQVLDGVVASLPALEVFRVELAHFAAVNRPSGDDAPDGQQDLSSQVVDVRFAPGPELVVSTYFVAVDVQESGAPDVDTLGARVEGELPLTLLTDARVLLDVARQRGEDGAGRTVRASYAAARLELERRGVGLRLGLERLGASSGAGRAPFLTPLASTNDFNGWLDRFATTPDVGLVDRALGAFAHLGAVELAATWHDFEADRGGADLGSEWDLQARWRPRAELELGVRLADYRAGSAAGPSSDATSVAVWASFTP